MGIGDITTRVAASMKMLAQMVRLKKSEQEKRDEEFTQRIASAEMNLKPWDSDQLRAESYESLARWGRENGVSKELVDMMDGLSEKHRMKNEFASCELRYDEQQKRLAIADKILSGNAL